MEGGREMGWERGKGRAGEGRIKIPRACNGDCELECMDYTSRRHEPRSQES